MTWRFPFCPTPSNLSRFIFETSIDRQRFEPHFYWSKFTFRFMEISSKKSDSQDQKPNQNGVGNDAKTGRFFSASHHDDLNANQTDFVKEFVNNGGNACSASKSIGKTESYGYRQLTLSHVREAIQIQIDKNLKTEGASIAWGCIRGLLLDSATPAHVRLNASKWVLEHSGMGVTGMAMRLGVSAWTRPLTDLSEAELEALIQGQNTPILDIEPSSPLSVIDRQDRENGANGFSH